jgi:hypothetical protein
MSYELTGKLVAKFDAVQKTGTFKVREFVVEKTDDIGGRIISNFIKFQSSQEKTTLIDQYNEGSELKVFFNIRGNKWEKEGKVGYITNLDAWKIEGANKPQNTADNNHSDAEYMEPLDTFTSTSPEAIDDLPF